jgi:hypothetical protein
MGVGEHLDRPTERFNNLKHNVSLIMIMITVMMLMIMNAGCGSRRTLKTVYRCYSGVTAVSHSSYTVVTLLLHCYHTVVTLLLHCCYTVITLLSHTVVTLLLGLHRDVGVGEHLDRPTERFNNLKHNILLIIIMITVMMLLIMNAGCGSRRALGPAYR